METIDSDVSISSQKGYRAGYANGVLIALKVGKELGSYEGFAAVTSELRRSPSTSSDKKRDHLERIVKSCADIKPLAKDGEIFDKLDSVRGLAKRAGLPNLRDDDSKEKNFDF
uniref:Essential protein Yae1 N-terminal domain-containing protein n=1 Tax=Trichuris muris TaxID=70415 RepID=A0A5S6QQ68_TRIMR